MHKRWWFNFPLTSRRTYIGCCKKKIISCWIIKYYQNLILDFANAGLLGSWIYCCNSFLWSCRDVNWHIHSLILPGFWRAWDSTICSSPSNWNSQWPEWNTKAYTRTPMKYLHVLFSQLWTFNLEYCWGAYFCLLSSDPCIYSFNFWKMVYARISCYGNINRTNLY